MVGFQETYAKDVFKRYSLYGGTQANGKPIHSLLKWAIFEISLFHFFIMRVFYFFHICWKYHVL